MGERASLIPDHFKANPPDDVNMNVASIIWGLSLGVVVFNCAKAFRQSKAAIKRRKKVTAYVAYLWLEIISSFILGIITWLFLRGFIQPSFQYFFVIILLWSAQVQCLIQIIINRVGLLMVNRSNATKLKWLCFAILLAVNVSVFCIWIPARMQISPRWIKINNVWDRVEKVIFALMDAALNFHFIYTVKKRLIANGLHKYNRLYQMNLFLVAISITLDILLIAMMSLPNDYVYVQFHPLVYLVKLHIEMNMADLIGKVVKAGRGNVEDYSSRSRTTVKAGSRPHHPSRFGATLTRTHIELGEEDEVELKERENIDGIKKTVITEIRRTGPTAEEDDIPEHHERAVSEASSTAHRQHDKYDLER